MNLRKLRYVILLYAAFDFFIGGKCGGFLDMSCAAAAQFTTVSGTVTDPNGLPYANGTITAILVSSASPTFTAGGAAYTPPSQPVGLSAAGSFVMQLADVTALSPGGSTWSFTVNCSGGCVPPVIGKGPVQFTVTGITISGASQSITATLTAAAPALTAVVGGGGTGTVSSGTATQLAIYNASGTVVSSNPRLTDNGTTLAYTGAGGINAGSGGITTTGTHVGASATFTGSVTANTFVWSANVSAHQFFGNNTGGSTTPAMVSLTTGDLPATTVLSPASGTTNVLPKYTAASVIAGSLLTDNGSILGYSGAGGLSLTGGSGGSITLGGCAAGTFVKADGTGCGSSTANLTSPGPIGTVTPATALVSQTLALNPSGTAWTLANTRYTTAFTQDVTDYGFDVRGFGALLSGTGVAGGGVDDTSAIGNCLNIFRVCTIPAIKVGATTHVRLASSFALGGTEGNRMLICAGGNRNGFSPNSGTVSLDVDNGGGVGPSLIYGTPSGQPFNGFVMVNCHVKDISASANSPGFIVLQNVSNAWFLGTGGDGFQNPPLTAPTNPGTLASCSNSGGFINSAGGNLSEQLQWIGANGGASPPSTITTGVTMSSLGCTTGTSCSCLPTTMSCAAGAQAVEVFWCQGTSCVPKQMGLPFACSSGTVNFGTNFVFGGSNTPASSILTIPTSGQGVDNFNHSGGSPFYTFGTSGQNCGNNVANGMHGDVCNGTGNANQNHWVSNDFSANNVDIDIDAGSPVAMISDLHSDFRGASAWAPFPGTVAPTAAIQSEGGIIITGCHMEGNPANSAPHFNLTGFGTLISNCDLEAGTATSTGIKGTALKSASITNFTCAFLLGVCVTDDVASGNNTFMFSATSGTVSVQPTDTAFQTNGNIAQFGTLQGAQKTINLADRFGVHGGIALTTAAFGTISANCGSTATISAASGREQSFSVTLTLGGTGQATPCTFVYTFPRGTWGAAQQPRLACSEDSTSTFTTSFFPIGTSPTSATTETLSVLGTVGTSGTIILNCVGVGV